MHVAGNGARASPVARSDNVRRRRRTVSCVSSSASEARTTLPIASEIRSSHRAAGCGAPRAHRLRAWRARAGASSRRCSDTGRGRGEIHSAPLRDAARSRTLGASSFRNDHHAPAHSVHRAQARACRRRTARGPTSSVERVLVRDDATLPQLAADRGDDRHRQAGRSAETPRRDWLEPRKCFHDRADTRRAFREPDWPRDLGDDPVGASQSPSRCWSRASEPRRAVRR